MKIKDIKISTKLAVSVAAFLLPLGIMLFSIISMSLSSIKKDTKELQGIEVLRPAIALMQSIPQYIRFSADGISGDVDFTKQHTTELFVELNEKYTLYFGLEPYVVYPQTLLENWEHLQNTKIRNTVLWSYNQLIVDMQRLISYTGNISGLVTDSDIESAHLVAASIQELPQAQERMVSIGNVLRAVEDGAFTQRRKSELMLYLDLLVYSDNARIQSRFNSAESLRISNSETMESYEILLKACFDRIAYFSQAVENEITDIDINMASLPALYEAYSQANNAAYRLQDAALDRLDVLIKGRINKNRQRFLLSIAAALAATALAFAIIIATVITLRNSTITIAKVFNRLDENDLSVQLEATSGDELGDLMKALGDFLNKLNAAFASFNGNATMVTNAVFELSSSAKQMTATANEQSASVSEIVSTMENNKDLSEQAAEKTVEVAQLAGVTQELSRRGANLRDINEDMMLDILNQNTKIIDIIKNLADMLSRIDESIQLIDSIADQTKLIAFNAALEASSSGEAGARFSVVAGEIRRFADNVVESAAEIKEKISEVQEASQSLIAEANNGSKAIKSGYDRMVEQKEVFKNIVEVSQNVADRSQQISSLSKQQELASAQVFSALKEISSGVNHFVSATSLTSATVEKLNIMSIELKETLAKYHTVNRSIS